MKVTAQVQRSEGWWAITVREVPGVFTQTRRLDQVPKMVTEAVRLMLEDPALDLEITVAPHTQWDELLEETALARAEAEAAAARAAQLTRNLAVALTEGGLTVRDAGHLLNVSPQRVSQLVG
ncbi:MAG: hypothetical protein Q4G35_12520 [Propionibacteriaceae bacterium]|nr:hypothetical protein [Propionibacteriaceae bacterium]